jgi:murein DD-endopeptidase MepM/ murein hydrolase activator NlpD
MSFINLYSFIVDFQRDIKSGDDFKIYYEYQVDPSNGKIKDSKILYASLNTGGISKEIYRHEMKDGKIDYFDAKGQSVRRALLKTPVSGARISSRYGMRKHPVLGYSRMHRGVDYAAPRGTPIFAAGDGVVSFAKNVRRGYGKHVQIRHNSTYSTLYGHMSKFAKGIKSGTRVKQGQIIGYVGATGLASGPHLHYEVKVRGKQVNPSKINYMKTEPLKLAELERFKKNVALYDVIVENAQSTTMVAKVN